MSGTFAYDYKMSTSGSSAKNSHLTQGRLTTMMPTHVNRITSQCKIKLSQKYCPWINLQLWNFCHSFFQWMCSFSWLLCFAPQYMFIQIGSQTRASLPFVPLAEVRIPRRATARAHFLFINKGVGQFYLSFDTRQLTIPIPFSRIANNVQQEKPLWMHCITSKCKSRSLNQNCQGIS